MVASDPRVDPPAAARVAWAIAMRASSTSILSAALALSSATCVVANPYLNVCGNGVPEAGNDEECDEGQANADDAACTATCKLAICGDGLVQAGVEECDLGEDNDDAGACTSTCALARCGDGLLQPPELCDDGEGNKPAADGQGGCSSACEPLARCGDKVLDPEWETCDDGNDDDTDACPRTCQTATCGDGFIHAGVEVCDDGNLEDDDNCPSTCAPAACGDGFVDKETEECDDGNDVDTDACLSTCVAARCGDGVVREGVEECDDGDLDPDNGCNKCVNDRLVFVTEEGWGGDLGGFGAAYARCQKIALDFGHPDPSAFYAWISDGDTSPSERFIHSEGRYVLSTGQAIADNWDDLTDGTLKHPIDRTIDGILLGVPVWTATRADGTPFDDDHCMGWTSSGDDFGRYSYSDLADEGWTDYGLTLPCGSGAHLYCFEAR